MTTRFFHREKQDEAVASIKQRELNDEQLEQVAGGYIIDGPAGEQDWLRRQRYARSHPGSVIPLVVL